MKVVNLTAVLNRDLKPLVDFARARAGILAELATVQFREAGPDEMVHGLAIKQDLRGTCTEPSVAIIWLSPDEAGHYPHRQQVVPELAPVVVNSWIEEVLLVIAHELRHVVQFWDPDFDEDPHMMEVDAEAFAIETLNAWRGATAQRRAA